jgi:hypothetical protein
MGKPVVRKTAGTFFYFFFSFFLSLFAKMLSLEWFVCMLFKMFCMKSCCKKLMEMILPVLFVLGLVVCHLYHLILLQILGKKKGRYDLRKIDMGCLKEPPIREAGKISSSGRKRLRQAGRKYGKCRGHASAKVRKREIMRENQSKRNHKSMEKCKATLKAKKAEQRAEDFKRDYLRSPLCRSPVSHLNLSSTDSTLQLSQRAVTYFFIGHINCLILKLVGWISLFMFL